jgi:hypothetical protein
VVTKENHLKEFSINPDFDIKDPCDLSCKGLSLLPVKKLR